MGRLPSKKEILDKATEIFMRREAKGSGSTITPEESELSEGGFKQEARRELMTGESSEERQQKIAYGKELAKETDGQFFPKEEWRDRQGQLGLAKWRTQGYKHIASQPKVSTGTKIADVLKDMKLPHRKKFSHTTADAEAMGYPVGHQRTSLGLPSMKGVGRFILGDPAVRQKRKAERRARKEKFEVIKATAYERGLMKGVAQRSYAKGYHQGRGTTGRRGGSGLYNVAYGLNMGAQNLASIFGGETGNLGMPVPRRSPPRPHRRHPKKTVKHRRRRQQEYDPFGGLL